MSFNPHSIMAFSRAAPEVPRGLVTCQFEAEEWPAVPVDRLADLAAMKDLSASGACFISHARSDLDSPMVAKARQAGLKALCWTIRSASEEALARKHADNVTFENYRP